MASVTLTLTSYSNGVGNFTIYCGSIDPGNIIAQNVSTATLAAGFCTEELCSVYVIQSNTPDCNNAYYVNVGPTPTAAPTSTPGVTGTPTPTPTPTATSPFPTATATPGGPTPTPFPTSTPTGTATPTPTPFAGPTPTPTTSPTPTATLPAGVYGLGISDGTQSEFMCTRELTGSVYSSADPTTWTEYNQRVYTDPNEVGNVNYQFNGGNLYYRLKNADVDFVWSISDSGLVSEKGNDEKDCGTTTTFYVTVANFTYEDPCEDPTIYEAYSQDFTTVTDMQNGDRIFLNSALTTQLYDGWSYAIADTYDGTANKRSFDYYLTQGVTNISLCATPTPVPTSTPTPTPFVSYEYFITVGAVNNTPCFTATTTASVYSDRDDYADILARKGTLYTDSNLTTPFDGNDLWYGLTTASGELAPITVFVNNTTGLISTAYDCGTPPPTPTPTLPIYQLFRNNGYLVSGDECLDQVHTAVYTQDASGSAGLQNGDRIYTDAALTSQLNDGYAYGIANTSGSYPEVAFNYTLVSGITDLGSCGEGTPVSMSSYHFNHTDACNDTSWEFTAYVSGNVDPYNMQTGDKFYENPQLTEVFGINNLYYGIYSGSQSSPVISYQLYTGSVKEEFTCPTPTATPTPTPTATPFVFFSMSLSAGSTDPDQCGASLTGSVYSDRPLVDSSGSALTLYTDTGLTTTFTGGNFKYRVSQSAAGVYNGYDGVYTISNAGNATNNQDCSGFVAVYTNTGFLSDGPDVCDFTASFTRYSQNFTGPNDIQNGDRIYSDSSLTSELLDGYYYGIASSLSGEPVKRFQYSLSSGVTSLASCAPSQSSFFGTSPTVSPTNACSFTTGNTYYISGSAPITDLVGKLLYTDAGLTTEVNANNQWIGLGYFSSPNTAEIRAYYVSGSGITAWADCDDPMPTATPTPTPTTSPTPTATPVAFEFGVTEQFTILGTDACYPTLTTASVFTDAFDNVFSASVNDQLWNDSNLTIPFTGSGNYVGLSNNSATGSIPEIYVRYNDVTYIVVTGSCPAPTPTPTGTPTPTPTPSSTPTPTPTPTGAEVENYFTSVGFANVDSPCLNLCTQLVYTSGSLAVGKTVYTDSALTTPFNGNDLFWGYGLEDDYSQYSLEISGSGLIIDATVCS